MGENTVTHDRVLTAINKEKSVVQNYSASEIVGLIENQKLESALGYVFYFATKVVLDEIVALVCEKESTLDLLAFATYMAIGLQSAQTKWHLEGVLNEIELKELAKKFYDYVEANQNNEEAKTFLKGLAQEVHDRYVTEARTKEEAEKGQKEVASGSLTAYITLMLKEINESSLFINNKRLDNAVEADTVWGNDFGAFLRFALWCGASFQTTNPPLVKAAWDLNPKFWQQKTKEIYQQVKEAKLDGGLLTEDEQKVALMTYCVVEHSCHLMRDLYLFSEGRLGFVCYQVNPNYHNDSQRMADEIEFVHSVMQMRLKNGYEPNISFKVPGTKAALETAKIVGAKGISLTVTLSFGVFQAVAFARVFKKSKAAVNSVVIMNGRLSFPVRDHLLEENPDKKDHLLETAKYIGVDVTRHLYEKLYNKESDGGLALDPKRMRIMNASLRIYGNDIPDVLEVWGSPSITIFPNVRYALNAIERTYDVNAIKKDLDADIRSSNALSEMFRQSWYVEGDDKTFAPEKVLTLETTPEEEITSWVPIVETLTQFLASYAATKELIGFLS
jgi:transaldolase